MIKTEREKIRLIEANKLLIMARWFYVSALLLTGVISKITGGVNANINFSPYWMIGLTVGVYGYNSWFLFYFRRAENKLFRNVKIVSFLNLILDQFSVTIIIFFAGGLSSISFLYYLYPIAASGFFFSLFDTAVISSLAAFLYGGLILSQYYYVFPYLSRYNTAYESIQAHNPSAVFTNLWAVITSFFIVGAFVGLMAKSMRRKEKEVRVERDRIKSVIANLVDGLIYIDNAGRIDMTNPRAEKLLDFKASDILEKNIENIDFTKYGILGQLFRKDNKSFKEIVPRGRPDIAYRISSFDIRDEEKKLLGRAKIIRDVSREKFVNKMKSEFVTIAGHQLRTPLSAIKGGLDLLRKSEYGKINKEQKNVLNQSYEYTERLIQIVNDLLNISSIEEGRYDYKYEKTDIHDLLREVSERFIVDAEKKNIDYTLNIVNNLNPVELDAYKFKLAIGGIINNAISYTPEKGKVTLTLSFEEDKVMITVEDNGIGIPKQEQSKVFTKFFRSHNALKFLTEGNGLDLFVAKNIIENHKGQIWFESEVESGTTFYIEIPIEQNRDANNIP